ncbi:helix-turn-helix transcriptional regulator [Desulfosediminicola ganghwensis]|uniref:helix-turn-helix transcriptional regulator n=1 Tax=Desulfosediminicola ganghwensis TaxID=2569540 RepID=UPI0010AB77C1|nr:AraC family transcriptional regulator [Desulfosediminicola ganghwensis]
MISTPGDIIYASSPGTGIEALSCVSDFHFGTHIHDGHVIWLNSAGGEHFSVKGDSDILQPGSVSVIEPGVAHTNHPCEGSGRHLRSLYLAPDFFSRVAQMFIGIPDTINLPTATYHDEVSWRELLNLHEAVVSGQEQLVTEQFVVSLFTRLWRNTTAVQRSSGQSVRFTNKRFSQLAEVLHSDPAQSHTLSQLAELAGCTEHYVIRLFKKHCGISPHAYLVQLRLEKARRLLGADVSIADAAFRSGFADQSHLTRKFKERYGLTPGRYVNL